MKKEKNTNCYIKKRILKNKNWNQKQCYEKKSCVMKCYCYELEFKKSNFT